MQTNWTQEEQKLDVTATWCKTLMGFHHHRIRAITVPICIHHRGELGDQNVLFGSFRQRKVTN